MGLLGLQRNIIVELASVGSAKLTIIESATVFRSAPPDGTAAVIAAHNRPPGDPTHARDDQESTRVPMQVGILLRLPLLDNVIVAGDSCTSLAATVIGNEPYSVRATQT